MKHHTPPQVAEIRTSIAGLLSKLHRIEAGYRWLHASGYTKSHASAGQIGDPADMQIGDPAAIRYRLRRAAGHIDDAYDAAAKAAQYLSKAAS